jgi:hypothetical protein
MEADWSVEIGPGQPSIDACWAGFLDLRTSPHTIDALPEPAQHPALRDALQALNAPSSTVFTTKCDTWTLTSDEIDPDEFDASPQHAQMGFASYIDVLDRNPSHFSSFAHCEQCIRDIAAHLRSIPIGCSRADIVARKALSDKEDGYAITLYVAACGAGHTAAYAAWQNALAAVVAATIALAGSRTGE